MGEAEIAEVYRQLGPAIYAHCRRLLGSDAAARDATQEVFVRALEMRGRVPSGEEGLRYLFRISTNLCLNQLRAGRVRQRGAFEPFDPTGANAETAMADRNFVHTLLERCGDRDAEIALLHYVDGMSQVEIAAILGITRRTVWNRLRRIEASAVALRTEVVGAR